MEETFAAYARPVPERKRKPTLELRNPATKALVDSLPCVTPDRRGGLYAWSEWIIAGARSYTNAKQRAGLFAPKDKLTKIDADRAWIAAFGEGGVS